MSHYKSYPTYKDSGVEWIARVPEHWGVKPICRVASCNDDSLPENVQPDQVLRYVDISSVNHTDGIAEVAEIRFADAPSRARRRAKAGDVVISTVRTYLKAVAAVTETHADCTYSTGFAVLRPRPSEVEPEFLKWLALNDLVIQAIEAHSEGLSYPAINATELVKLKTVVPPPAEQSAIAAALDRETARIDALIAKKTHFIELLKEKRQALITHAVTKGLDQNVRMKDSGVAWIGEVPEHWELAQLGKLSVSRCDGPFGSGLKSEHYTDSGVRVVRLQNIGWARFKAGDAAYIAFDYWQSELGGGHDAIPGDVLIAGLGDENNLLGRACVVPDDIGNAIVKADCYRFRVGPRVLPEYVALTLSATSRAECGFLATGATRDRLNLTLASARRIPVPPIEEQREIVAAVHRSATRLDELMAKVDCSIALLKERRSALITAAVTGQIDLREAA
jgi:type I restriction enzyme S subunit